jgi:hypothetical protein
MIRITDQEIGSWRVEIQNAEDFRDKQLGSIKYNDISGAGENIDYFETGVSGRLVQDYGLDKDENLATVNVIFPIVKNVIPTLYWKNPYISAIPKRVEDETSAPFAGAILNYYFDELDIKGVNRQVIFDSYVIGMGVCKIGYATQFGSDIPDGTVEERKKQSIKDKFNKIAVTLGLKKPPKEIEERENVDLNEYIKSESPYVVWISPFDFGIDPAAHSIHDARFVFQKVTKKLSDVKNNPNYTNTDRLNGVFVNESLTKDVPETQIDQFKTIDLYEIHYKTDDGIRILTIAKDGEEYKALRHEESPYKMDGFQFEVLTFNKHFHKLYPRSDLDIVKGLQDRITLTFDNLLEQIDKYVPKIFVDETALTEEGKRTLRDGSIGAIVKCNKNPNEVVKEAQFAQLKGDLAVFIDKLLELVMLETGLTKAQLSGMTNAQTATEAQIGQAGQNLRMSDKFDMVADFSNRQARKLWQVVQQFVDLEEIQLITGDQGIDEVTGLPKFSWMPDIDSQLADKLSKGEYRFRIEVGSTEKPDLPVLRQQIERMGQILMGNGVLQAFQMQGYKINIAEIFKKYLQLYPDVFTDIGKVIQPIGPQTTGLMPPQAPPQGAGGPNNPYNQPNSAQPPNPADIISAAAGEKGQGVGTIA